MSQSFVHPARWLAALVLLGALVLTSWPAAAQEFPPRPAGPVYDGAGMLSPSTVSQLDQELRNYNRETGRAIIVATIPALPNGETIESYSTALFTDWGIGGAKRDMGLLLLIARDDRKMRIEVGYGLHGYFGGIMADRVIRDTITPNFKAGNFDAGVTQGVDAILAHLAKSPADAAAIEEAQRAAEQSRQSEGGFPIGALIWLAFIFFFFILPMIRGGRRYRRHRGLGRTAGDIILWEVGSAIAREAMRGGRGGGSGWSGGGGFGGGGGGGFGGFGGGMSGGGGASGSW